MVHKRTSTWTQASQMFQMRLPKSNHSFRRWKAKCSLYRHTFYHCSSCWSCSAIWQASLRTSSKYPSASVSNSLCSCPQFVVTFTTALRRCRHSSNLMSYAWHETAFMLALLPRDSSQMASSHRSNFYMSCSEPIQMFLRSIRRSTHYSTISTKSSRSTEITRCLIWSKWLPATYSNRRIVWSRRSQLSWMLITRCPMSPSRQLGLHMSALTAPILPILDQQGCLSGSVCWKCRLILAQMT